MIIDHKEAIFARLNSNPVLSLCGHEGVVLPDANGKRPAKYWTAFFDSGRRGSDRLGGLPTQGLIQFWIHWVGKTPEQVQGLADLGVPLLAGCQLTVDGYDPHRIRHVETRPVAMDDAIRPPLHFSVDVFSLYTQPI